MQPPLSKEKQIAAIVPRYTLSGNITVVMNTDGSQATTSLQTRTLLRRLAYSCQRRIKFDRNAGWKLTHFAGGLKRRILLTPVRVSPVYPWWRYQPVAQSLSQLLTYPLICKFRREY